MNQLIIICVLQIKKVAKPEEPQKYTINNWFVVTGVQVTLLRFNDAKPMKIWGFNALGCCDKAFTKRGDKC